MDVIIIGAGAAGMAAAAELARHKRSVLVLEARDRIGGRCWSRHESGLAVPLELGAEFIHGRPAATLNLMQKAGIALIERTGTRWFCQLGKLQPRENLFAEIEKAMRVTGQPKGGDVSFAAFLAGKLGRRLSETARAFALRMVEGYDAADPARVSARAIVEEWTGEGSAHDVSFRPLGGYGALMGYLVSALDGTEVRLQLQTVVQTVRWKRGRVEVEGAFLGKPFRVAAARAIVTLPLGVLQAVPGAPGAVRFTPGLKEKQPALKSLASGPVLKVILRFRTAFWEEIDEGRYREAGFFQTYETAFPTFWTATPMRAPVVVAWAGGPRASRMAGAKASEIIRHAMASLKTVFGERVDVESQLVAAYVHDWQRDPYARGAYSYVTVGGSRARKTLAAPLQKTLYFAGEAADFEGEAGTVAGALQSGVRAARELLGADAKTPGRAQDKSTKSGIKNVFKATDKHS